LNQLLERIACTKLKPDLHRSAGQAHRTQPADELLGNIALHILDHEGLGTSDCQNSASLILRSRVWVISSGPEISDPNPSLTRYATRIRS
jgi:hypothetical protein